MEQDRCVEKTSVIVCGLQS